MTTRSDGLLCRLAGIVVVAALAGCATAPVGTRGAAKLPFPSPLSGPGHPRLTDSARRQIDMGWRALLAHDFDQVTRRAERAGESPAADLLSLQAEALTDPASALNGLGALVKTGPGYASAWITLSHAAEAAGREEQALAAARTGARLWPAQRWVRRATELEDRWIGSRLAQSSDALEAGDTARARTLASAALNADPGNRRAILLLARADVEAGRSDDALQLLARLQGDPDAVLLEGRIAEKRGRWARAMELYQRLPDADPRKGPALERVKRRWRIMNLPAYVQEAIESPSLTRAQLAVLLGNLLPELLALPTGDVPLMTDIVDLPSQREIVAVVAAGLMRADPIEHIFEPDRMVTAERVRTAVEGAAHLTGRPLPRWCRGQRHETGCYQLSDPPTGEHVSAILIDLEEEPSHE